ncbi:MAG: DUF5615 family PIN-like protein [Actinomycetota bacterium]
MAGGLTNAGFDALHVGDVGLLSASDAAIIEYARAGNLIVVTCDSDFAAVLAIEGAEAPSIIHLRNVADLEPAAHLALLVANLGSVSDEIAAGAIVSLSPTRLATRRLPIRRTR